MHNILTIFVLLGVVGCGAQQQESTPENPVVREQELAKNNDWHAAKLRGVAFRAIGQEPGWLLEIKNGEEILIVTDYGKNKNSFPLCRTTRRQGRAQNRVPGERQYQCADRGQALQRHHERRIL